MGYFRRFLDGLEAYVPGEQPRSYEGVIKLNANENPFPPSLKLAEVLTPGRIDELRYYPDAVSRELRRRLASLYGVSADNVFVGNGGDEVLRLIVQATVDPGDRIRFPYPSYVLYRTLAEIAQAEIREVDLTEDFQLPADFETNIGSLTFLCSPNNPTGNCLRRGDILRVIEAAKGKGIVVIDEAYVDFSEQNMIPLAMQHENVLVLRSLSKSYSLAGLRVGVAVAHYDIISALFKLKDSYNLNFLSQILAMAALDDKESMRENVKRIRESRAALGGRLENLGFRVWPSDANFLLVEHPKTAAVEIYHRLKEKNILVRYFNERRLESTLRISVGREDENAALIEALNEIP
jgi:histidinol-phosphate aminotransferase